MAMSDGWNHRSFPGAAFLRMCKRAMIVPAFCLASMPVYGQVWQGATNNGTPGEFDWTEPTNWSIGVPNAPGAIATFGGGSPGGIVVIDAPITVDTINFNNGLAYTLSDAGNQLLMNGGGGNAAFNFNNGAANVATDVGLVSNTIFDTNVAALVSGDISGGGNLSKTGADILSLSGNNNAHSGATIISTGRIRSLAAGTIGDTSNVSIGNAGTLDLNNFSETIGGLSGLVNSMVVLNGATLTTSNDLGVNDSVFAGTITGNAGSGLVKQGDGMLTLSGTNTFEGTTNIVEGDLILSGGSALADNNVVTLQTDADLIINTAETIGSVAGTGDVTLNADLTTGTTTNTTLSGVLSGAGGLTKQGTGTFTLSGANTYTGATTINAGTLQLGANDVLANTTAVSLANGATFDLNNFNDTIGSLADIAGNGGSVTLGTGTLTTGGDGTSTTFSGIISGTGGLTKEGAGTFTLNGANTYTGATMINAGVLQSGMAGVLADTTAVTVAAGATLDLNDFDETIGSLAGAGTVDLGTATLTTGGDNSDTTFSGVIDGTGGLTKAGTGTFIVSGANTYTGATTIDAGTLQLGMAGAIANTSAVIVNMDGTFDLNNFDEQVGALSGTGNVMLGTGNLTVGDATDTTFSGIISGTGGVTKEGTGTLTLSGMNTYSGGTTINDGVLQVGADANLGAVGPGIGELTFNGGTLAISADLTTARDVTVNAPGGTINTQTFNATLSGIVSGAGALTKTGTGTLTLTGTNTYMGGTNINGGTVSVGSDLNLGDSSGAVTFTNGGTLQTTAAIVSTRGLTFNNPAGGTIDTNGFDSSFSGLVTGAGNFTKAGAGTLTLSNSLAGYTGNTTIAAGTLNIDTAAGSTAHVGSISGPGNLTKSGANTLTLSGNLDAYTGMTAINGGILDVNTAAGNTTLSGAISGVGALTKSGANTLILSGTNTYSGDTDIDAGILQLGAAGGIGDLSAVTVAGGATFDLNGFNEVIGSLAGAGNVLLGTGTLTTGGNNSSTTYSGVLSGDGGLVKVGTGTMILSGVNLHTGGTAINGGILSVAMDSNLGGPGGGLSFDGGTLLMTAAFDTARAVTLNAGGGSINTNGFNSMFTGVIDGTGALTKLGGGTLTLTGMNSYAGGTNINGGILSVGLDANLGAPAGPVTFDGGTLLTTGALTTARSVTVNGGGGTVNTNGFDSVFSGGLSGTGNLTKDGAGILTLSGPIVAYSGDTTINAGTVDFNTNSGDATHAGAISGPGTLAKSGNNTLTVGGSLTGFTGPVELNGGVLNVDTTAANTQIVGNITGVGSLAKSGPNVLTLFGMNTYSGPTSITGGTLLLGAPGTIGDLSAVTVAAGATFNLAGNNETIGSLAGAGNTQLGAGTLTTGGDNTSTEFSGALTGAGSLVKEGTGIFTLGGINSYMGGTTVNAGTVAISTNLNLGAAASTLTLDGGTLQTNSSLTSDRAIVLNAGGGTINTLGFDPIFSGVISGPGALTKTGTGILTLNGVNTHLGGTTIDDGTLSITSNANLGDAASTLTFDGGTLRTAAALNTNRAMMLNAAGGTVDTNGFNSIFTGIIAGPGGLTKTGAGTLSLNGVNTYTGPTSVNAGRLDVNGSINSNTTVANGATLGGNGTINGNVVVQTGATMAPGNSIGQINVNGNYAQQAGSFFELEIQPAVPGAEVAGVDFDQTNVTGTALVDPTATVNVVQAAGNYQLGTTYRFLQTTGGVTGSFAPLAPTTFNGGLLVGNLVQDANSIALQINQTNFANFAAAAGGTSKNQRAVGAAIDQFSMLAATMPASDANAVINQLLVLPANQLPAAFNQIGGASHASQQLVALQTSVDYLQSVRNRVRTSLVNNQMPGGNHPVWVEATGSFGEFESDGNAPGVSYDTGGVIFGADQGLASGRQGISVGIHHAETDSLNGLDQGEVKSYNFTAYTSTIADPVYILGVVGYGRNEFDSTRRIGALIPDRVAAGNTNGNQFLALLEYGLTVNTALWDTQVFVSGQYAGLQQDAFTEVGAGALNLIVNGGNTDSFRSTVGIRMAGQLTQHFRPEFNAGFVHEFQAQDTLVNATFNGTNITFQQCGVKLPQNMGQVGVGGTFTMGDFCSLFAGYNALVSDVQTSHAINASIIATY